MFDFLVRSFLVLISMTFISGDRVVHAQSLQKIANSTEEIPTAEPPPSSNVPPSDVTPSNQIPADATPAEPEQPRQLRRHIGIGGSVGISGEDTGLSEGGFSIISRHDLNDTLSIRGTNVFGRTRTDNTMALTANFPIRSRSGEAQLIPFVGGGVLISSKSFLNDVIVRGLVTGGVDVPLSRRFTATTTVNIGFIDTTNVGVQFGVMYGF